MRRMVPDGVEVYRAVIVKYKKIRNPAYVQGGTEPYYLMTTDTHKAEYGPYTLSAAKAVVTRETVDHRSAAGTRHADIHDAWIERANVTWEKVDLSG